MRKAEEPQELLEKAVKWIIKLPKKNQNQKPARTFVRPKDKKGVKGAPENDKTMK